MTLSADSMNAINVDIYEDVMRQADTTLCRIREEVKGLKHEDSVFIASDLMRVILSLREALE